MRVRKNQLMLEYPAVFNHAKEGGYDVFFPDFPGCVTFGRNFEEAKEKATEVLMLWLEELRATKQIFPIRYQRPIIDEIRIIVAR